MTGLVTPAVDEPLRAKRLSAMKRRASGLLVIAAAVFVWTHFWGGDATWVGYLRAASEAAMVGGVADWFAVTALFRHPLGIPIPHTALIKRGKDAIGRGLGEFVQHNFLDPDAMLQRVVDLDVATRLGEWLAAPDNARIAARQLSTAIAAGVDSLEEEEVQESIRTLVADRVRAIEVAPLVGTVIDKAMEGNHHHALVDATLAGIGTMVDENDEFLRELMHKESPWWVPDSLDDAVFRKANEALQRFLAEVGADRNHELRIALDERARHTAAALKTDPHLVARGEVLKEELLAHPDFQEWTASLWTDLRTSLMANLDNDDSALHDKIADAIEKAGLRIGSDPALAHRINTWAASLAHHAAERFGVEAARLIASTVARWDADDTSRRIELQIGRDLQFIRINGTIVGGLVGLAIHAFTQLT